MNWQYKILTMDIIQKAAEFVFALFKDKLSPLYYYHNFNHSSRVVNAVTELSAHENLVNLDMNEVFGIFRRS